MPDAKIAVLRHKPDCPLPDGADYIFFSMVDALKFSPQLAVIANPASFHISSAMPLAEAGVNLLVEKPLAPSLDDAAILVSLFARNNNVLATGYNLRFLPSLQKFKALLDDKIIGDVWSVRSEIGQFLPSWRPNTDYREGVSAQRILGGGVLFELSHEIDYLLWIFGEIEWVQAVEAKLSNLEIDVEDTAHLIFGFVPNDSRKSLIASVNLDFIRQDSTRICTAIGELGSLRWNGILGTVELLKSGEKDWYEIFKYKATYDESYIAEWTNIIAAINSDAKQLVTGLDGLKVLQIIETAREAAKIRAQVKVRAHSIFNVNKMGRQHN
jgi:predicted dehydrogenase